VKGALLRYRVMAWIVGVLLVSLVFVAMPLKYLADQPAAVRLIGVTHGYMFILYLVTAVDLALRSKWRLGFTVLVCLAGTVPFFSFVAEHKVTQRTRPLIEQSAPPAV
jgi:integral membrane protein